MTDTRTVCRVCGRGVESTTVSMSGAVGGWRHDDTRGLHCDPQATPLIAVQPVAIKPCDECKGSGMLLRREYTNTTANQQIIDCYCAVLDGKPSPFRGWVVAG